MMHGTYTACPYVDQQQQSSNRAGYSHGTDGTLDYFVSPISSKNTCVDRAFILGK